jgi:hypothetical protein
LINRADITLHLSSSSPTTQCQKADTNCAAALRVMLNTKGLAARPASSAWAHRCYAIFCVSASKKKEKINDY